MKQVDIVVENEPASIAKAVQMYQLLLRLGKSEVIIFSTSKEAVDTVYMLIEQGKPERKHTVD